MISEEKRAELTDLIMYRCLRCGFEFYTQEVVRKPMIEISCLACGDTGYLCRTE